MSQVSFDPVWEGIYEGNPAPRSPYDFIASFVFRNAPRGVPRDQIKILEVGCGGGNNLWFLASEGFSVTGLDGSAAAIKAAQERLEQSNLNAELSVDDFTALPFEDESFDLVFDRGALTCCGHSDMTKAINEVHRVLKPKGCFFFNPIADTDTSYRTATQGEDGLSVNIKDGDYASVGQICFVGRRDIDTVMPKQKWIFNRIDRVEVTDMLNPQGKIVASWRVEAAKI